MPAKNSSIASTTGMRFNPINKTLWRRFKKKSGIDITFKLFQQIIWTNNELMMQTAAEHEAGIELPEKMGYVVVTKYKSNKRPTDWVNTNKLKQFVPLLNLHSFGYVHHIKWFKMGVRFENNFIYSFRPYRIFKRQVAKNVKEGVKYHTWENTDFWTNTKLERTFEKFYKPKLDSDDYA